MNNDLIMDNYLELATGIIGAAVGDYMRGKHWINNNPQPTEDITSEEYKKWKTEKNSCERDIASTLKFLDSQRFEMYTHCNQEIKSYLLENMEKIANLGKTVDMNGETRKVDASFMELATKMLTDRVREVVKG